jgi:hypothetical protein
MIDQMRAVRAARVQACGLVGLVGLCRDSYRNPPEAEQMTRNLAGKMVEIARARRRFGLSV